MGLCPPPMVICVASFTIWLLIFNEEQDLGLALPSRSLMARQVCFKSFFCFLNKEA